MESHRVVAVVAGDRHQQLAVLWVAHLYHGHSSHDTGTTNDTTYRFGQDLWHERVKVGYAQPKFDKRPGASHRWKLQSLVHVVSSYDWPFSSWRSSHGVRGSLHGCASLRRNSGFD